MTARACCAAASFRPELADRFTVFIVPPARLTRVAIEDLWELYGSRRLSVVAESAGAAGVVGAAAVGHRPDLVCADGSADKMRRVITETVVQLRAGDVLLVVSENQTAARDAVAEGMRRRTSRQNVMVTRESRAWR